MAYVRFDSGYAPCGMLIVQDDESPYDETKTVLVQTDWDFPGVAACMGWLPCECGGTDGTIDCDACGRTASDMISEAYEWIREREGETFDCLNEYLQDSPD